MKRRVLVTTVVGLVSAFAALGCSGTAESGSESGDLGTQAQAIVVGSDASVPHPFKSWSALNAPSNSLGDAAFCTPNAPHSMVVFTRDTSNFIQGQSNLGGNPSVWAKYGSGSNPRQLGGRPACGFVSEAGSPFPFILIAKGAYAPNGTADTRLFWSQGNWIADQTWTPPVAVTPFAAIDSTQFAVNGNPAVATHEGQLVVTYLNDSGQLLANYWTGNGFSATVTGPTLPSQWVGVGTPTIAFARNWAQKFIIFVRAKSRFNTYRLFETFFENGHFTAAWGGTTGVYQGISLPTGAPAVASDPAYEFDYNVNDYWDNGTLYYRSTNGLIYQVSATNGVDTFSGGTLKLLTGVEGNSPTFIGNPLALGGVQYESGSHWLLARGDDNTLWFAESFQDYQLAPN